MDLAPHLQHFDSQFSASTFEIQNALSELLKGTTVAECSSIAHDGRDDGYSYNSQDPELVWSLTDAKKLTSLPDQQGVATIAKYLRNPPVTFQDEDVDTDEDLIAPQGYPKINLHAPLSPVLQICYSTDKDVPAQSQNYNNYESSIDSDGSSGDDIGFTEGEDNGALYTNYSDNDSECLDDDSETEDLWEKTHRQNYSSRLVDCHTSIYKSATHDPFYISLLWDNPPRPVRFLLL